MNEPSPAHPLITFLTQKMSMTDVYQPAVIMALLRNGGVRSKEELARTLAQYDTAIQEYYEKIVMRWPRITLTKHEVIAYEKRTRTFRLVDFPENETVRQEALEICGRKIEDWLDKKAQKGSNGELDASLRYQVLKDAHGKCELCGIPASLRPIDIDHIVPRSKANKHGKVHKDGEWIGVNARSNLQALCMTCNRAKRAADETDFRRAAKLVRDKIPAIIRAEGRDVHVRSVSGAALTRALFEKLIEEHSELIAAKDDPTARQEELVDMAEVIMSLAPQQGVTEESFLAAVRKKVREGSFREGSYFHGCLRLTPNRALVNRTRKEAAIQCLSFAHRLY